jgi:hypothetical protein
LMAHVTVALVCTLLLTAWMRYVTSVTSEEETAFVW